MQAFTSKATSINSSKAPAVYGMKKAVALMTGKAVIDVGGGRFDTAALPGWQVTRSGRLIVATH